MLRVSGHRVAACWVLLTQTIATCQRNISRHCWAEQSACVWPPSFAVLRHVGCYWLKLKMVKFEPTTPNTSQHCPTGLANARNIKPRPNDRNMSTQHIAILLGATCCARLVTLLCSLATCWALLVQIWPCSNLEPTTPNMSQHGARWWPNARNMLRPTMSRYVALTCCDRLAEALLRKFVQDVFLRDEKRLPLPLSWNMLVKMLCNFGTKIHYWKR